MREIQSNIENHTMFTRRFIWAAIAMLALVVLVGIVPMSWEQQAGFGVLLFSAALVIGKVQRGRIGTLVLVLLSMCATARYAVWRVSSVEHYFSSPWQHVTVLNAVLMALLLGAEIYTFIILFLGYMQSIAPLRRPPLPMPSQLDEWPTVDVMIPTINEPLEIVRFTVLAAKQLDWPEDKLKIWLLDDGNRPDFRSFARESGVEYVARSRHDGAKAGNINHALGMATGELVVIFDCDHVPTRSFLQVTVGWFQQDSNLGMLQTPHHFYSPDPFERNLGHFRNVPNEAELFYGVIQDTNDFWNATFFCGSSAVLRRSALNQVGLIATETVTEDAHTSLRLQKRGWNTAYINLAQSGGLATDTLGDHVKQRIRWARGMAQILRLDNPLFARNLSVPQRLCYLNAMLHFMYALPRLIFLTAPILYLVFGRVNLPGNWLTILLFALPHLSLSIITNSRIQGFKRYSFWSEIHETVLAPYILLPSILALISPKFGKFNPTPKGQNSEGDSFDRRLARPFLLLLALNILAVGMSVPRYLWWEPNHTGTILVNSFWAVFNVVVLGVALSVCWRMRQRRGAVRIPVSGPIQIESMGVVTTGTIEDISVEGASAMVPGHWRVNDSIRVKFPAEDESAEFLARIVENSGRKVRLAFELQNLRDLEAITRVVYSPADRWINWTDGRSRDNISRSLISVFGASFRSFGQFLRPSSRGKEASGVGVAAFASRTLGALLVIAILFIFLRSVRGETVKALRSFGTQDAEIRVDMPLKGVTAGSGLKLDRKVPSQDLWVDLPSNVLVKGSTLHLKYSLPASDESSRTLEILLNDTLLAAITPNAAEVASQHGEAAVPVPAELLVRENRFTMRLGGAGDAGCVAAQDQSAPISIDPGSTLSLVEDRLVLANDLNLLPEPFLQRNGKQVSELPIAFGHQPTSRTLEAAGVLASWFGSQRTEGQINYPVSIGALPKGNAMVLVLRGEEIRALYPQTSDRAQISIITNPVDPFGKLLVFSADNADQMLVLTQAFATGQIKLSGEQSTLGNLVLPSQRMPDDAPRWVNSSRVSLESLNGGQPIRADDSKPWNTYLRLAPDLNFGTDRDIYLHLDFNNNAPALDTASNLSIRMNGAYAASLPLQAGGAGRGSQQADIYLGNLPASEFGNTLQTQFSFAPPGAEKCGELHASGSLGSGSYLDLGKPTHLAKLPNLRLFSMAGFPFTRYADLSQTAIVMPEHADARELTLYLTMLGYFAEQTGYPALRVEVGNVTALAQYAGKDILFLGTYGDLSGASMVNSNLPLQLRDSKWNLSTLARVAEALSSWLNGLRGGSTESSSIESELKPDGTIEQIRSPFSTDRTLTVILGRDTAALDSMTPALMSEMSEGSVSGNVSLWQGGKFLSHSYSASSYYVAGSGFQEQVKRMVLDYELLLAFGLVAVVILMAFWLNGCIQYRIQQRLMGVEFDLDGNPNSPNHRQEAAGAEAL